ncbi:hypothetical protein Gpo141_00010595 [Globisporangium polare]
MLLQPLSTASTTSRAVVHRPLLHRQHAEPSADIVAVVDSKHAMTATLEVYFRPPPPPPAQVVPAASFVSTSSLQLLRIGGPSMDSDANNALGSLEQRTADYTVKRSLADLKKLRADLQSCVGKGEHCAQCKQIVTYMTHCWERPRMLNRAWNGAMSYQLDVLAKFVNLLLRYASQLGADEPEAPECHAKFGAIVSAFLQESANKDN